MSAIGSATRALVTGGAGFIGSHLVDALVARGSTVEIVDNFTGDVRSNLAASHGRIAIHEVDLNADEAAEIVATGRFDVIFHLAGHANVQQSVADPRSDFEQNLAATFRLLETVRTRTPATRLVFASSATVYGEPRGERLREDAPCFPIAPYAISKLASEHQMRAWSALYGLKTTTVRMLSVYGPRQRKQVIFDLMRKITADPDRLPLFGDGTEVRDLNYVSDAVDAMLLIAERAPFAGEAYNVAAGSTVTIRRVAEMICARMGVQPEFIWSGARRTGETQGWEPCLDRVRALGYAPAVTIEQGLDATVRWFQREAAGR